MLPIYIYIYTIYDINISTLKKNFLKKPVHLFSVWEEIREHNFIYLMPLYVEESWYIFFFPFSFLLMLSASDSYLKQAIYFPEVSTNVFYYEYVISYNYFSPPYKHCRDGIIRDLMNVGMCASRNLEQLV